MGTRSITTIIDNQFGGTPVKICTMYRQYDGYLSGHGKELAEFLATLELCNGIGGKAPKGKEWANGAGCLAAQMIAHFKTEPGGIYVDKPRTALRDEDYGYEVTVTEGLKLKIVVRGYSKKVFSGDLAAFTAFCAKGE